ncbi:phosphopantetheine-binding protein, partial [Streptomyces sp. NPDC018584]|uniref:acyl carrier protein n=1 Tax=unclassified Streptomyces TaxID=2593676 RepID=UPI0037B8BF3A
HTTNWPTTHTRKHTHTRLPTYPFQHTTHWLTSVAPVEEEPETASVTHDSVPLLVRTHVAAILGVDDPKAVDRARTFKDLGFDSMAAVELHRRLCAATGLRLAASLTFDHPTPDAVVTHVRSRLAGPAEEMLAPLLSRIDGLREMLTTAGAGLDDTGRGVVAARLGELAGLFAREGAGASEGIAERIDSASDSEMLDFITNELGIT